MLQTDSHDPVRFFRRIQASFGLGDRPGHCLFAVEVFAGGERVKKVARVTMQRGSDDDRINVFEVEQSAMIVKGPGGGSQLLCFFVPPGEDVGGGYELDVSDSQELP